MRGPYRALKMFKVDIPYLVTYFMYAPKFEWYMGWFGSKTTHQKKHVLKEIRLRVQNMITILGMIVNMIGKMSHTTI